MESDEIVQGGDSHFTDLFFVEDLLNFVNQGGDLTVFNNNVGQCRAFIVTRKKFWQCFSAPSYQLGKSK